ncbi:MAG: hypothetical protein EZS28_029006, partial [Streblomastix strix]
MQNTKDQNVQQEFSKWNARDKNSNAKPGDVQLTEQEQKEEKEVKEKEEQERKRKQRELGELGDWEGENYDMDEMEKEFDDFIDKKRKKPTRGNQKDNKNPFLQQQQKKNKADNPFSERKYLNLNTASKGRQNTNTMFFSIKQFRQDKIQEEYSRRMNKNGYLDDIVNELQKGQEFEKEKEKEKDDYEIEDENANINVIGAESGIAKSYQSNENNNIDNNEQTNEYNGEKEKEKDNEDEYEKEKDNEKEQDKEKEQEKNIEKELEIENERERLRLIHNAKHFRKVPPNSQIQQTPINSSIIFQKSPLQQSSSSSSSYQNSYQPPQRTPSFTPIKSKDKIFYPFNTQVIPNTPNFRDQGIKPEIVRLDDGTEIINSGEVRLKKEVTGINMIQLLQNALKRKDKEEYLKGVVRMNKQFDEDQKDIDQQYEEEVELQNESRQRQVQGRGRRRGASNALVNQMNNRRIGRRKKDGYQQDEDEDELVIQDEDGYNYGDDGIRGRNNKNGYLDDIVNELQKGQRGKYNQD